MGQGLGFPGPCPQLSVLYHKTITSQEALRTQHFLDCPDMCCVSYSAYQSLSGISVVVFCKPNLKKIKFVLSRSETWYNVWKESPHASPSLVPLLPSGGQFRA